jgi:hypothetical protein
VPIISVFFGIIIRMWAVLHQAELQANWERMKAGQPLNGIAPLE